MTGDTLSAEHPATPASRRCGPGPGAFLPARIDPAHRARARSCQLPDGPVAGEFLAVRGCRVDRASFPRDERGEGPLRGPHVVIGRAEGRRSNPVRSHRVWTPGGRFAVPSRWAAWGASVVVAATLTAIIGVGMLMAWGPTGGDSSIILGDDGVTLASP